MGRKARGISTMGLIIVNKHHGQIMIDSTLGVGTSFIIKIPITQTTDTVN